MVVHQIETTNTEDTMNTYGVGFSLEARRYTVHIDGRVVASYPPLTSALARVDAHKARETK